jgi:predicted pyridoxine 5'-phosphate oxidase superfamily flavin-nucleotide-binding protein
MMAAKYLETMLTESVRRVEETYYGRSGKIVDASPRNPLGEPETDFITARDSFYLGTVSETGWPYIQHRGGPTGFLRVLNPTTLAFPDYHGNRQLITTGNLAANNRVALFFMDYKHRERLKLIGHARVEDIRHHQGQLTQMMHGTGWDKAERIVIIDVVSYDWNCAKHIAPRYSIEEVEALARPLRERIAILESELQARNAQHA